MLFAQVGNHIRHITDIVSLRLSPVIPQSASDISVGINDRMPPPLSLFVVSESSVLPVLIPVTWIQTACYDVESKILVY